MAELNTQPLKIDDKLFSIFIQPSIYMKLSAHHHFLRVSLVLRTFPPHYISLASLPLRSTLAFVPRLVCYSMPSLSPSLMPRARVPSSCVACSRGSRLISLSARARTAARLRQVHNDLSFADRLIIPITSCALSYIQRSVSVFARYMPLLGSLTVSTKNYRLCAQGVYVAGAER